MTSKSNLSVKLPREHLSTPMLWVIAALIAVAVFYAINTAGNADVQRPLDQPSSQTAIVSPPPLVVDPYESSAMIAVTDTERPPTFPAPAAVLRPPSPPDVIYNDVPSQRLAEPNIQNVPVEQNYTPSEPYTPSPTPQATRTPTTALIVDRGATRRAENGNGNQQSPGDQAPFETLRLTPPNLSATVLRSGSSIPAILETAIDTSQAGEVRAMVNQNVRASNGTAVLVPRGARLYGRYLISATERQNRVIVNWTRLVLPDGYQVTFDFPTTDRSGASGIPGRVHTNSFGRLLGGVLQSALDVVTLRAANSGRNDSILVAIPNDAAGSMQMLVPQSGTQRRITVRSGTPINILVEQDIDFSRTGPERSR